LEAHSSKSQGLRTSASSANISLTDAVDVAGPFCSSLSEPLGDVDLLENIPLILSVVLLPRLGDLRPFVEDDELLDDNDAADLGILSFLNEMPVPSLAVLPPDDLRCIGGLEGLDEGF